MKVGLLILLLTITSMMIDSVCCVKLLRGEKSMSEMKELREELDVMRKRLVEKRSKQLLRSRLLSERSEISKKTSPYPVGTDPVTSGDTNLPKEKNEERFADLTKENDSKSASNDDVEEKKKVVEEKKIVVDENEHGEEKKKVDENEKERFAEQKVKGGTAPWWLNPPPWWLPPPAEWGQPPATIYSDFYTSPHFKNGNYPASYPVYNPYPLSR